jgi:hypothetical protein
MCVLENVWTFVTICVPDRLPQSLGLCRILGGGDKKSMGLISNCDCEPDPFREERRPVDASPSAVKLKCISVSSDKKVQRSAVAAVMM